VHPDWYTTHNLTMSEANASKVRAARLIGALGFYVSVGLLGREICPLPDGGGPLVCLAAGAGVALVALAGPTMSFVVFAGSVAIATLTGRTDVGGVAVLATCNALGALGGGTLLARARFDRIADIPVLLAAATVMAACRWLGVTGLGTSISTVLSGAGWRPVLSSGLGVLAGAPAMLAWARHRWARPSAARAIEISVLFVYIVAISVLVFASSASGRAHDAGLVLLPLPLLVWAAMRFDPRMASSGLLAMMLVAAHGAVRGLGPFASNAAGVDAILPATFFAIVAISILALAATASERHDKAYALWRTNKVLREIGRFAQSPYDLGQRDEHDLLAGIGRAAGVCRVYVFEVVSRTGAEIHARWRGQWVAPGARSWSDVDIERAADAAQADAALSAESLAVVAAGLGPWVAAVDQGEAVALHLEDEVEPVRSLLARVGTRSTLCVRVPVEGRTWGVIGLDVCRNRHDWSSAEVEALRIAAGVFGCAIGRARAVSALERSERRYRALTERSADLVAILDADLRVTYVSPQIEAMVGTQAAGFVGSKALDFVDAADQAELTRALEVVRARPGQPVSIAPTRVKHADPRRVVYCEGTVANLLDDTGIRGLVCNFRDVTARIEAEARERALEAEVRHARQLEQMSVIAGGLAHDFNNHLSRVLGYAELALQRLSPADVAAEPVRKIAGAARDAEKLGRQLVACSGRGPIAAEPVDVCRDVLPAATRAIAAEVGPLVELAVEMGPVRSSVLGDAAQLREMVEHLLRHAAESLDGGQGRIDVSAVVQELAPADVERLGLALVLRPGAHLTLVIADSGKGIDTPARERFFEPVFAPDFSGHGLAMAACLGIVRGHRGAIQVESRLGVGTTRTVLLPAMPMPSPSPKVVDRGPAPPVAAETGSVPGRGTVLVVDDDPLIRDLGREILELAGFDVVLAADGVEALEVHASLEGRIACVVLDLTMPRLSGERTLVRLRERDPELPVLLASGYTDVALDERFARDPRLSFVAKPFTIDELQRAVQELLRGNAVVAATSP